MDFELSAEQRELRDSVVRFGKTLSGGVLAREEAGEFFRAGWDACAEFGIQGLPLPEIYGGSDQDIVSCLLAMQALGYGCDDSGLVFALNSHIWTCEIPILLFGSDEQKQRYLPAMARGEIIGGHAMTEPNAGSDASAIATTATKTDAGTYVLNGSKTFISNAPISDVLLVFASTNKARGWAGITAFLVDRDNPGMTLGKPLHKLGLKTSPTGEVALLDCEVPGSAILGRPGQGFAIFNAEMEWERSCLFASHLGAMQRQLETCVDYAKTREQFGKPIGEFQAIAHKLADMRLRIELGELILHKVAWLKSQGKRAQLESSIAKLFVSESYVASSLDAMQIHGGYGYMAEYEVDRGLRDAVGTTLYSGTSEIQRNIIARMLGLKGT